MPLKYINFKIPEYKCIPSAYSFITSYLKMQVAFFSFLPVPCLFYNAMY